MNDLQRFLKNITEEYNLKNVIKEYNNPEAAWKDYVKAFGKRYTKEEKDMRKAIFMKNKENIEKHNALFYEGKVTYSTKLNQFSDKTREELNKMKGFRPHNLTKTRHRRMKLGQHDIRYYHSTPNSKVPAAVDWRKKGYVTPVKFQGDCSSCYAFAGIGALEAYHKKKTGNLIFREAQKEGIESDYQYPYTMNASRDCKRKKEHVLTSFDDNLYIVKKGNEVALQHAVANYGPVAVGIGTAENFFSYGYGVFHPTSCGSADLSALIVGYGIDPLRGDYWIIKNSYGQWFGEDGYMRMARNKNNICEVATHTIFPMK